MKYLLLIITLLLLHFSIYGQNTSEYLSDTLVEQSLLEPVSDTIPDINIFEEEAPLDITLKYDITSFIKEKREGEYLDAELQIHYGENYSITKNIKIKARGNFRRGHCFFPPIHLNFKKDPIQNSVLTGKIKLVTHCTNSKHNDLYIFREYLTYKMYNILSDYSLRVRLLNIHYIDTGTKKREYQQFGFLIEPVKLLAKRTESVEVNPTVIRGGNILTEHADLVALFQYMIGNTDWRFKAGHNTRYIKNLEMLTDKVIPIPYDFDFSGFVGTSYSFPQSWTSIESINEREYLGYCRDENAYFYCIKTFADKKEDLTQTISAFEYISDKEKKYEIKFLNEFLSRLEKPERLVRDLKNQCRTDF